MRLRSHDHLFEIAKRMPTDFAPHGGRPRISNGVIEPDCADDCRFFGRLEGGAGIDWGGVFEPTRPALGETDIPRVWLPTIRAARFGG